jgi:hypothetical protein
MCKISIEVCKVYMKMCNIFTEAKIYIVVFRTSTLVSDVNFLQSSCTQNILIKHCLSHILPLPSR